MKAIYTIHNFAKRLVIMLAVGLMAVNAWGATYTYDFHSCTASSGGAMTYWYSDAGCNTHLSKFTSGTTNQIISSGGSATIYYKDASIPSTAFTISAGNTAYFMAGATASTSFFWGKSSGNYITLPTYSGEVITKVKVTTSSSVGQSIEVNIYSDTNAASTSYTTTGCTPNGCDNTQYNEFNISSTYQSSSLKLQIVTDKKNFQITEIQITTASACDKSVTVSNGGSSTNGSITSITTSPVATCSSTASDRQVSILVTPSTGYVAPTDLSVGTTTGTVNSSKVSRTDNGNGTFTFVYGYNQNDNGTISYNAACVGKQCTVTFDKNSGTGGDNSVTATYGSAMTAIDPPTREHFDFGGYYDSETDNDGTGNKYYNSDGTSAADWNKNTTAATTLYAKWTEHGLKNYRTVCCTELGYVKGAITWPTPTKATIIWDAMSNVAASTPYAVTYRTGSDSYSSTNVSAIRDTLSTKKYCTITGLTAGTSYDFKIAVTAAANYCDKDSVITATAPKITVSGTPAAMSYVEGDGPSDPENFSVSGVGLTGNLTVTAPENFEVCKTSDGTYTSSVTLTPTSGTVSSTTIYVRLASGLDINDYGPSNVSISGGSAATVNVSVSGVVSPSCHTPTISANPSGATYNMNATATALSVTAAKGDEGDPSLTYQWYVSATNDNTAGSVIGGATSSTYTPPTTTGGTKYYYCVVYSGACSKASTCAAVTVNTPTLTASVSSCAFSTKKIDGTYTMTLTISGTNLAKDATVAYAIGGDDDDMFSVTSPSSPISQTSTGALSATTITVQYAPTSKADHSATLTFSSTGASNVVINLTGTGQYEDTYMTAMHETDDDWEDYAEGVSMAGDGYTIPNPGDIAAGDREGTGCEGIHYHFAGWVTDANKEAGTISGNIIAASGTTNATNTTYWAVWEKETTSASLTKLTSSYEPQEGDNLVIVAKETSVALYQQTTNTSYVNKWSFSNNAATVGTNSKNYITLESDGNGDWYLGDGTNGYVYNGNSNDLVISTENKTAFSLGTEVVSSATYFTFNNGRWLSYRSDLSNKYYRLGGDATKASGAYGNALFDLYKYVGLAYGDPKVECICSADPVAGTAAVDNEGTFSASSIAVKATGASTGHSDCSYTDYGFVWSSSVTTPTLVEATGAASTNCTKIQVDDEGEVTSFTGSITGSFTANNPIYVRSYVKNGKAEGTYQYSSVVTITPRSVTFTLNGHGSSAPAAQFVNNGSKATDPSYTESVTGYIFGGWYKEVGCTNQWNFATDVVSGESKTLYAKWTPISYSVRFNDNDENYLGTATGSIDNESYHYDESKALTANEFSLAGYDFAGWATTPTGDVAYEDEAEVENLSSTNGATVDLYAIWSPKTYDVTLAATDETSSVGEQVVTATYNAAMPTTKKGEGAVVAPSRTGYTFTGWEYSSTTYYNYDAGTSTLSSAHVWDQPNSTTTLTPKWSINSYTLTWNLGGGTVATAGTGAAEGATGTPSSSVVYNSAITVPTVTRAGYNFAGWDITPASNMPASDVTYTATWTAKTLTSISLAEASVSVYVGEIKYVNVIFDPTDILSKAFSQAATLSYCQLSSYSSYNQLKITGGRAGADVSVDRTETVSIKYTADETKTASITVTVKPLPTVTFVDLIHNKSDFANSGDGWTAATGVLSSTVTSGVVSHAGKTPTHADVAIPVSGNACEQSHLHLIGWIDADWADEHPNATHSEIMSAGTGVFYEPNANIDLAAKNGKTFLAVWSQIE